MSTEQMRRPPEQTPRQQGSYPDLHLRQSNYIKKAIAVGSTCKILFALLLKGSQGGLNDEGHYPLPRVSAEGRAAQIVLFVQLEM